MKQKRVPRLIASIAKPICDCLTLSSPNPVRSRPEIGDKSCSNSYFRIDFRIAERIVFPQQSFQLPRGTNQPAPADAAQAS